jgi:cytochrome c oxidase subunit III
MRVMLPVCANGADTHFGIEAAEVYWHFVDVVWIILFSLLYLLR